MLLALSFGGCGGRGNENAGPSKLLGNSQDAQKESYQKSLDQAMTQMESQSGPTIEESIASANRKQLEAMAKRWDSATASLVAATPPDDINKQHAALVKSMEELGKWNWKIAQAAPDKQATKKVANQALNSKAAANYSDALNQIKSAGYDIGDGSAEEDPL